MIHADSHEFNFKNLSQSFDVILIDGDHSYDGIYNDTAKALACLKNEDSGIVWHDYAQYNEEPIPETLNAICKAVPESEQRYLYYVENTMCAIYDKGEIASYKNRNV